MIRAVPRVTSPEPDLPLADTPACRFLAWISGGLIALVVVVTGVGLAAQGAVREARLLPRLATIVLPAAADASTAAVGAHAVLTRVRAVGGVAVAALVEDRELAKLVEPWLGERPGRPARAMPRLIDVTFVPGAEPDLAALERTVTAVVPGARVDDATPVAFDRERTGRFLRTLAVPLGVVLLTALAATVVSVVRTSLEQHRDTVDLLRLMGAADGYVARQFEQHALTRGLRDGVLGFAGAVLVVLAYIALRRLLPDGVAPELSLRPLDWIALAAVPLLTSLLMTLVARLAAQWSLARIA